MSFPSDPTHLLPLVDVEAVVLKFLLEDFRDVDVHVHRLLLALPLDANVRLDPLKYPQNRPFSYGVRRQPAAVFKGEFRAIDCHHFVDVFREGAVAAV